MGVPQYKYRYRQHVQVRVRNHTRVGEPWIWLRGIVKDTHGKGLSVQVTEGKHYSDFFHWSEVRPDPDAEDAAAEEKQRALGKLADVMPPSVKALSQPAPAPEIAAPEAPPEPEPEHPQSGTIAIEKKAAQEEDPDMAKKTNTQPLVKLRSSTITSAKDSTPPPAASTTVAKVTPIQRPRARAVGDLIRSVRLETGMSQYLLAKNLGIEQPRVSQLELGKVLPTDEELIALTTVFKTLDLGELETMRDREQRNRAQGDKRKVKQAEAAEAEASASASAQKELPLAVALPVRMADPEPAPAPAPPAAEPTMQSRKAPALAGAPSGQSYDEFLEWLLEGVPMPADREGRKNWLSLARRFFEMRGAS